MALSINETRLAGRPTEEFKLYTKGDFNAVEVNLAVDDSYFRNENDEMVEVERTRFLPIKFYGPVAVTIAKLNPKGKLLYVECKAVDDHWTDKEGKKHMRIVFEVLKWQFVESKTTDEARRLANEKLNRDREAAPVAG